MADTQDPNAWSAVLPSNVTRTVRLQPAADETRVDGFTASRMLSRTNAATLRQSSSGRLQETGAATAMFRESDAFGRERNFPSDNKGMDGMEGTNAITRGLGAIRREALTAKPGNMEVAYRASTKPEVAIGRGNKILDMGHFAKAEDMHVPQKVRLASSCSRFRIVRLSRVLTPTFPLLVLPQLPSGRRRNYRGAVTTASRAEVREENGGQEVKERRERAAEVGERRSDDAQFILYITTFIRLVMPLSLFTSILTCRCFRSSQTLKLQNKHGGGMSPARGAPRMAAAKIAMARIDSKLKDVSTTRPKGQGRKKKRNKIAKR
jgi:hypothetical protein